MVRTSQFGNTSTKVHSFSWGNSLLPSNSFFKEHGQLLKCGFGEHNEKGFANTLKT